MHLVVPAGPGRVWVFGSVRACRSPKPTDTVLITDVDHELRVARYIVLNPVEAGLATHPRRWKWSSYRATVGSDQVPSFLSLAWLDAVMSRSAFASFVEAGLAKLDAAA